jgi:hypothetical protein
MGEEVEVEVEVEIERVTKLPTRLPVLCGEQ